MSGIPTDRGFAEEMDRQDPLAEFAQRFSRPVGPHGVPSVYFCGNSLGLQPRAVRRFIDHVLADWADRAVDAHFRGPEPWLAYHRTVNEQMAGLVGALPDEVVVMNALTVNLHLLLTSFYAPTPDRFRIVMESRPFPSDLYAVRSHLELHGRQERDSLVFLEPREGESTLRTADLLDYLRREGSTVALVLLGGVQYVTGQWFDISSISAAARRAGCVFGLDLAHAVGNVPLELHAWDVDFAVWCTYKYVNAGPGAPGGCFVHQRHGREAERPRLAGWWGEESATRFRMDSEFVPATGAAGWQISNPSLVSLASLRASLELFHEAGITRLREKSVLLTGYLEQMLVSRCEDRIRILTPSDPNERGAQLSVKVIRDARRVFEGLLEQGVVCDWREPGVVRLAPVPFYNTFCEVFDASRIFSSLIDRTA